MTVRWVDVDDSEVLAGQHLYGRARRDERKREAARRQESRAALTVEQQLAALDARYGIGQGATGERRRLVMSR